MGGLLADARQIIDTARANAVRSEEEQHGKDRAEYGSHLIRNLAAQLEPEYGSGFGVRQLEFCRQFYRIYPIANTVCSQLNWSQYKLLISIGEPDKREYYQLEAVSNCWTTRRARRARPTA